MADLDKKEEYRALYGRYLSRCNAHDFLGMQSFYSSPTVNINDQTVEPEFIAKVYEPLLTGFPDLHFNVRHFSVEGDKLSIHFSLTATHKGTFKGVEATGRKVTMAEFAVYHVVDGKFADIWALQDPNSLLEQIKA